jgi:hypothetical protein
VRAKLSIAVCLLWLIAAPVTWASQSATLDAALRLAGYPASVTSVPVAFPTASRPQAWAAGTPLLLLSTLLDLHPGRPEADVDVPCGIGHVALLSKGDS